MKLQLVAVIPFAGFYDSCHSSALDYASESLIQDEDGSPREGLADHFAEVFSYSRYMLDAYARLYVSAWAEAAGIKCEFAKIDSPREYNFETDRIFVYLAPGEAVRLFGEVSIPRMTSIAKERHTSRSGFISYYSPDWLQWGPVDEWEPEQLHTLILASLPDDMPEEHELVDDCNGAVSDIVYSNLTEGAQRIVRIADYLRERDGRARRSNKGE